MPHIRRALISVSDKSGILDFARALQARSVEIISTGGTAAHLRAGGVTVTTVADLTGFPEVLDGRVKTLHPRIHAGILADLDNPLHTAQLAEHGIAPIDMLVINLYPFEETVARPGVTLADAVEQIDIGGPAMIRAGAKNYRHTAVLVNPSRYPAILAEMDAHGGALSAETCFELSREVFRLTAAYDGAVADHLDTAAGGDRLLPPVLRAVLPKEQDLRYGENPHQRAALYGGFLRAMEQLHGKELSYNNILDISAAAALIREFPEPAVAIIKHTNPCGVGTGATLEDAYGKAFATDRTSAFGGIVAVNRPLDAGAARIINEIFTEVIIAPAYADGVLDLLRKKKDRRLIRAHTAAGAAALRELRAVPGGLLVQESDAAGLDRDAMRVVTQRAPSAEERAAMEFAWRVAKHVKSNAIVYARADRTIGVGAGQMSRVDSARIASRKAEDAGLSVRGTAVASDAFFPFADGLLEAVRAGATAVIQPGGSVRDEEVIRAADESGIAMVFTGIRHFKH